MDKKRNKPINRPIKAQKGKLLPPAYIRKANMPISNQATNYTDVDLTTLRSTGTSQNDVIKAFLRNSADASFAVSSKNRFAITDSWKVIAYTLDGAIDVENTIVANQIANGLFKLRPVYTQFTQSQDLQGLCESALIEISKNGGCGAQLVLDNNLIPVTIEIFSVGNVKYEELNGRTIPTLMQNGVKYILDSPLITIVNIDQDVTTPYSSSPYLAATQPMIAEQQFLNDLRRAFRKTSFPRVKIDIMSEAFLAGLPLDIKSDPKKLKEAQTEFISMINGVVNSLEPEDALVFFDSIKVDYLHSTGNNTNTQLETHSKIMASLISSGLHTLPAILGRGGSGASSSTEAMAFLREVEGYQIKLNTILSQMLTVATRLTGADVYVDFTFAPPELRPTSELESFKTMRDARLLQQLSLGMIPDVVAVLEITGRLPGPDYVNKSGTGFYKNSGETVANPYSNTSVSGQGINDTRSGKDITPSNNKIGN